MTVTGSRDTLRPVRRDHLPAALPLRTIPVVAAASVAVVIAGVAVPWALDGRTDGQAERWSTVTSFESAHGIAVWWSTLLLLLVALLAYSRSRENQESTPELRIRRRWQVLAGIFAWTSFDHATHAHVEIARLASTHLGVPQGLDPSMGMLFLAAVVAGGPIFRAASPRARYQLAVGAVALVSGAWGVDALRLRELWLPRLAGGLEAGLEWAGLIALAWALTDLMAWAPTGPHEGLDESLGR